jgi:hypothetical protein
VTDNAGHQMTYQEVSDDMARAHLAHVVATLKAVGGQACAIAVALRAVSTERDDTVDVLAGDAVRFANALYREANYLEKNA